MSDRDDFDEPHGDARLGEGGIDYPDIFTGGDPAHVAICYGGPEEGRTVHWQGVPVAHVPAIPPVLGIVPTWEELNVPMCYHRYVLEGSIYQWDGRVNADFQPIARFPWENS